MNPNSDRLLSRWFSLLVAAFTAGILVWLFNSPVFDVRDVSVHRADSSPPPAIDSTSIKTAAQSIVGRNVFRVDTNDMRTTLQKIPGVSDALVHLGLDGRATITVSYEAPVANWIVVGQSYLINADGEVLATQFRPELDLTVKDESRTELAPGDLIDVEALLAAYQLQENLPLLRVIPASIHYGISGLSVVDHAGRQLQFGDTRHLASKLVALHAVLEQANRMGERIGSVDLKPIDRPTYRTVDAPPIINSISPSKS